MDLNQKWKVGEKTGSKDPPRYIGHSVITDRTILELQCTTAWLMGCCLFQPPILQHGLWAAAYFNHLYYSMAYGLLPISTTYTTAWLMGCCLFQPPINYMLNKYFLLNFMLLFQAVQYPE
ncbi:hypothetical protein DPMN_121241 [Dreissena polymorpha]|uniref:Uncharacterized protein n=1 Tax=Dreissena polymorpha TaxID=45954 RepID=A0A9D4GMD3_DREPO|nr:hypothetical protein DPMN_121241 [Dreissena polymorpha]